MIKNLRRIEVQLRHVQHELGHWFVFNLKSANNKVKQKRTSRVLASGSFEVFAEAVAEPLAAAASVAEVPAATDEQ